MKNQRIPGVKGVKVHTPESAQKLNTVVERFYDVVQGYGFQRWELSILEHSRLFKHTLGSDSDIIGKEMYSFVDQGNEELCLRPEGTAGAIRAGIEQERFRHQIERISYHGPMFRRENPQKGRYRQFIQCGIELIGYKSVYSDLEIVEAINEFMASFGDVVQLEINCIGNREQRKRYSASLVEFLQKQLKVLDDDSQRRLLSNPIRILDSKDSNTQDILRNAPRLFDFMDSEQMQSFEVFQNMLTEKKIAFTVNPLLVRGLDYYSDFVYEWKLKDTNTSQNTLAAGGRYDQLLVSLGSNDCGALGAAVGIDRFIQFVELQQQDMPTLYLIGLDEESLKQLVDYSHMFRTDLGIPVVIDYSLASLKTQLRHSNKYSNCIYVILGEKERKLNKIMIQYPDANKELLTVPDCVDRIQMKIQKK